MHPPSFHGPSATSFQECLNERRKGRRGDSTGQSMAESNALHTTQNPHAVLLKSASNDLEGTQYCECLCRARPVSLQHPGDLLLRLLPLERQQAERNRQVGQTCQTSPIPRGVVQTCQCSVAEGIGVRAGDMAKKSPNGT